MSGLATAPDFPTVGPEKISFVERGDTPVVNWFRQRSAVEFDVTVSHHQWQRDGGDPPEIFP